MVVQGGLVGGEGVKEEMLKEGVVDARGRRNTVSSTAVGNASEFMLGRF